MSPCSIKFPFLNNQSKAIPLMLTLHAQFKVNVILDTTHIKKNHQQPSIECSTLCVNMHLSQSTDVIFLWVTRLPRDRAIKC